MNFTRGDFDRAFDDIVLGGKFFEPDGYYPTYRRRYERTLRYITEELDLPDAFSMIEVGGGQVLLLGQRLVGCGGKVVDVNDKHAATIRAQGIEHEACDLLREDVSDRDKHDVAVLCEVIEHIPVPSYLVVQRIMRWVKPGGYVFITTPNLHRLRNIIHLAMGKPTFCALRFPDPGKAIGHPIELSRENLEFHMKHAGLEDVEVKVTTLVNKSMNPMLNVARAVLRPLQKIRPHLQENLVAWGRRPADGSLPEWDGAEAQRLAREWLEQNELVRQTSSA